MSKIMQVVVAILQQPDGKYLLASRPQGKPWAGWWEFPGGKIEAGEAPEHALGRELQEELGITPTRIQHWLQRIYDYPQTHDSPAKTVHLHFFFVTEWQGDLQPHEGQEFAWQNPQNITVSPVLPANAPIIQALALPPVYAISNIAEMGEAAFLEALEKQLKNGLKLVQFREYLCEQANIRLAEQVIFIGHEHGAKILLNSDLKLAIKLGAHGVHLPSKSLLELTESPANLPAGFLVAASCHNAFELAHAENLGLDFVVLSPVKPTKSHENAETLGWGKFGQLIQNMTIPVYALGGMSPADLPQALSIGARGVAMQRQVWQS